MHVQHNKITVNEFQFIRVNGAGNIKGKIITELIT